MFAMRPDTRDGATNKLKEEVLIDVRQDPQTADVDRVVLTLDLNTGPQTGRASLAWLHDTHGLLAAQIAEWKTETAEFSGALARTGDASLAHGVWHSPFTPDGWPVLAKSLASQARGDASWWAGWLSTTGLIEATTRADAFFEEDGQGVSLTGELAAPTDVLAAGESALVDLFVSHGDSVASYGCVGSPLDAGRTALDRALRRSRAVSVRESRQWLRGYDWATLVPPELADRIDRRKADGELARVVELASGGLLLVGSEHFDAFDDAALERVFGVVEPVLPRGEPQTPKTYGDEQLPRLVWRAPQDDE